MLVQSANAPPPAEISTYRVDGTPSDMFLLGETVNITTYFYWPPYDISVLDPDGNVHFSATSTTERFTTLLGDITDEMGTWTIEIQKDVCVAITVPYSVQFFVIPDVPSSLIALTAFFMGLGFWSRRGRKVKAA